MDIMQTISEILYTSKRNKDTDMKVYILSDDETYLLPFTVHSYKGKIVLKKSQDNAYTRVKID